MRHPSLTTWYHGSPFTFDRFDIETIGHGTDQEGPGIYLTTSEDDAYGYSRKGLPERDGHVYEVRVHPEFHCLPAVGGRLSISKCDKLVRMAPNWRDLLLDWGHESTVANFEAMHQCLLMRPTQREAYQDIWYQFYRYRPVDFARNMVTLGFDGMLIDKPEKGKQHLVVYNTDRVRIMGRR